MSKKGKFKKGGSSASPASTSGGGSVTIDIPALVKNSGLDGAKQLIEAIERRRNTKLLCLVYNESSAAPSQLAFPALLPLEKLLGTVGKVPNLDVFLRSTGGITEVPWRIITLLREFTDYLGVIVSRFALSGAAHIAIAADELVMTPFSVLGSVDPTRKHPLLPKDAKGSPIPTSIQDLKHCIEFIQEQLGESYPSQNLALIISELFKYIDPLAIGALEQSYNLARLITRKCLRSRRHPLPDEQIEKVVDFLSGQYFSHSFLISRSEVETDLGLPVTRPDQELLEQILKLDDYFVAKFEKKRQAAPPAPEPIFGIGAFMQTSSEGSVIAQILQNDGKLLADPWVDFKG